MTERTHWPMRADLNAWEELANLAAQIESLDVDRAEDAAWEAAMVTLVARRLPYSEYIVRRQEALSARLKARKREQSNLRYKYGFRPGSRPRNPSLIRMDVKRYLRFREH
ncbi:hypothetical protein [Salinibacterium sp.]|uniref:hypothetical protein n=1 Tax=Salinibacterium sp. TaxID=1915057 RepID=UPI00286AC8BA|nr:hypothetical protein [Salinibacterium sp.]